MIEYYSGDELPDGYTTCNNCDKAFPETDEYFSWDIDGMPICIHCTDGILYPGRLLAEIQDPKY